MLAPAGGRGAFGGEKDDGRCGGRRSPSAETRSRPADCISISLVEAVVEVVEVAAAAGEGNGSRLDRPEVGNGSSAGLGECECEWLGECAGERAVRGGVVRGGVERGGVERGDPGRRTAGEVGLETSGWWRPCARGEACGEACDDEDEVVEACAAGPRAPS
jgi:hypothetical protein